MDYKWTAKRVAKLLCLKAEGLSASLIADKFAGKVSKNAVIGKLHRLTGNMGMPKKHKELGRKGLRSKMKKPIPEGTRSTKMSRPTGHFLDSVPSVVRLKIQAEERLPEPVLRKADRLGLPVKVETQPTPKPVVPEVATKSTSPEPLPPSVSVLNMTEKMCRWPVGHPGEKGFRYCCKKTEWGKSYCAEHHALCYKPKDETRKADRFVRKVAGIAVAGG